jgi:ethanolamine ammonia-lyase small subunit
MAGKESQNNAAGDKRLATPAARALAALRARTPARLVVGRAGPAYRTATQLELREDHAAAVDAVQTELDLARDLGAALVEQFELFEVATLAASKDEYLKRPELGRKLGQAAQAAIRERCPTDVDLQIAIGDGLSAAAVAAGVPALLPLLVQGALERGWTVGAIFAIRYCRVGVLNAIGDLVRPKVAVLLVGERPGLVTAESLSAYMAFQPRGGQTDADRNLISNIHARGVAAEPAAARILALAEQMIRAGTSGVAIKEALGGSLPGEPPKLS